MNKLKLFSFFIIFVAVAILTACGINSVTLSPATHFQGACQATEGQIGAQRCPSWAEYKLCILEAQSLIPDPGGKPRSIPIVSFTVGRIQLNNAEISNSWGLKWYDSQKNPVSVSNMEQGVFYTFKKVDQEAGFELVRP